MIKRRRLRKRQARNRQFGWQVYQNRLRARGNPRRPGRKMLWYAVLALMLGSGILTLTGNRAGNALYMPEPAIKDCRIPVTSESPLPADRTGIRAVPEDVGDTAGAAGNLPIDKADIRAVLGSRSFLNLTRNRFDFDYDGHRFQIDATLDPFLQNFLIGHRQTRYARYIGMVVMEPRSGRILSMVSFDSADPRRNVCTDSVFPAASVFKLVTAAASVEKCGFGANSTLTYCGRKHTLYKFQLKKRPDRGPINRISLRDSFAQSVNPVFGKLGIHYLGKKRLAKSADAFGFNGDISRELPVAPSTFSLSDDPYHWAEVASGFNRSTAISPLHGAVMAAAIVANKGRRIEPMIVEQITDGAGRLLYRGQRQEMGQAITPRAAKVVRSLMEETVRTGTASKVFRKYRKDPVFARLNIGGKTGTINSRSSDYRRFDWFVGFAEEKGRTDRIVLSIVVAHEKYIGLRSTEYARMAIRAYFGHRFAERARETATNTSEPPESGGG
ncbi:penicillin-binding protein [Desulfonema ishimotonii]|uniref:Penicillin-binding protein n=1 Tax=Desulfonema ishimotonii TaxID=45657 RepID=A0A401FQV9_9BACT|nr:penicillin-binding transpeptidase domain-containing protein [Desulfonema ishimotonii]GBC59343.1 penicillin-binding protein [Desulfonema ishimotonii]